MARKPTPEKYCEYCGNKLERIKYPSKMESLSAFNRRKYCNRECMRKAFLKKDGSMQTFSSAHSTARRTNNLILKKDRCEKCGSTKSLDIHHINGNWQDNSLGNLMCLCRSCHMKEHKQKSVCIVCGKPVKGKQYCEKHYQRYRKYGDPLLTNMGHGHIVRVTD